MARSSRRARPLGWCPVTLADMNSAHLARLCSADCGQEVTPDDVRNYLIVGQHALARFDADTRREIIHSILKESTRREARDT